MEKVNKGKNRRSASPAASTGPGPSAAVPSVSDPSAAVPSVSDPSVAVPAVNDSAASAVHVDSNLSPSPRSSLSPPPPSGKAPPPAAPVQHQQHQQQQQQRHKQRQGVKGSQTGRRQRAPAVPFDERVEKLWEWAMSQPQGSGGLDPAYGNMEFAQYNDDFPEYSDQDDFIPQSQVHPVHPVAQDDRGLAPIPATPRGKRSAPSEDVNDHQGFHPASNGRRARPGFDAPGSHARDMAPPRTSRAYGSRAVPPRSTASIR